MSYPEDFKGNRLRSGDPVRVVDPESPYYGEEGGIFSKSVKHAFGPPVLNVHFPSMGEILEQDPDGEHAFDEMVRNTEPFNSDQIEKWGTEEQEALDFCIKHLREGHNL